MISDRFEGTFAKKTKHYIELQVGGRLGRGGGESPNETFGQFLVN